MSMSRETWYARANAYLTRRLGITMLGIPLPSHFWSDAYEKGTLWRTAADKGIAAFNSELLAPLRINPIAVSPRMTVETEDGQGVTIWEEHDQGQMRPVRVVPRDLLALIDALQRVTEYFTPAELGFGEAADAYGRRVAEAQKTVGHRDGESFPDYMGRLVAELRRLKPAEDTRPDAD